LDIIIKKQLKQQEVERIFENEFSEKKVD